MTSMSVITERKASGYMAQPPFWITWRRFIEGAGSFAAGERIVIVSAAAGTEGGAAGAAVREPAACRRMPGIGVAWLGSVPAERKRRPAQSARRKRANFM